MSASRTTSEDLVWARGATRTPTLVLIDSRPRDVWYGWFSRSRTTSAKASADRPSTSASRIANSSPPRRTTVLSGGDSSASRLPTSTSSSSPTG
jgi:hypothetical protein